MGDIAFLFREWWISFKKDIPHMKKPFIILFCIYLVGLSSLIRANYNYMDDLGRTAWGYTLWDDFSRYITQFLAILVHADTQINDISPLPQLLAISLVVLSSMVVLKVFAGKYSALNIIAIIPLGLSPYFLECFSYKFDSPYMALSVLASVLPLLFIDYGVKLYIIILAVSTSIMLLTYQASSGIFLISLLLFLGIKWNQGKDASSCIKIIMTSVGIQLIIALIFKVFLVKEFDNYVSTNIASYENLLVIAVDNLKTYYSLILNSSPISWRVMCIGVVLAAVRTFIIDSKRNKIQASILVILLIIVCSALAYGAYIILEKPLFAARSFYGFGVFIAILGIIAINGNTASLMGKLACILLSWSLIVFSLAYGNALAEQKRYESFRAHILLNDISRIPGLDKGNVKKMQLKGNVGYSPVLQRMQKRYPMLNLLVNIQLKEGYCFGEFYLFNYFPLPGIEHEPNWGTKIKEIDDISMPVFMDTAYHTIKADDKNIVVILKNEITVYKSYDQV